MCHMHMGMFFKIIIGVPPFMQGIAKNMPTKKFKKIYNNKFVSYYHFYFLCFFLQKLVIV